MRDSPSWWYVHNANVSLLHTIFVVIADTFMMPVLFLISGAVQSIQLERKSRTSLIKKRTWRLLLPWLFGVLIVCPYLSLKAAGSLGLETKTWLQMITTDFWGDLYSQGPYWYLSLLFLFLLISMAVPLKTLRTVRCEIEKRRWLPLLLLLLFSALGYGLGTYLWGSDDWINWGFLWFFQPSRVSTYFVCFILGLLMGSKVLDLGSRVWLWGIISFISAFVFLSLKGDAHNTSPVLMGCAYGTTAIFLTIFSIGFARKRLSKENALLTWLSRNSYTLYLIHLPIQVMVGSYLVKLNLGSWTMWFLLVTSSFVFVWLMTQSRRALVLIRGKTYDN